MKKPSHDNRGMAAGSKRTQFVKGQSGNRDGRPKKSKDLASLVKKAVAAKVPVISAGANKQITKLEAAVTQLSNKAAMGDPRATQQLVKLVQVMEAQSSDATTEEPLRENEEKAVQHLYQRIAMLIKESGNDETK